MTFLPIATRELRASSRRRSTFRIRWITAASAALLAFAAMGFTDARVAGRFLFSSLTYGAFLFAVYGGTLLAADAISEERREGTLGLLFLTDLGGVDIVLGKLLITGLKALLALVSVLPVIAMAWLLGGVTGGEFWRTTLALLNALMFSLALALAVSAVQRTHAGALAWSIGWVTVVVFGAGLLSDFMPPVSGTGLLRGMLSVSPSTAVLMARDAAYRAHPGQFWSAFAVGQGMAGLLLGFAAFRTARGWRETGIEHPSAGSVRCGEMHRMSSESLERNPVLVLLLARTGVPWIPWGIAAVGALLVVGNLAFGGAPLAPYTHMPILWNSSGTPRASGALTVLVILIKVMFAWKACEFWADGRRSGALEILLSTPVKDAQILNAQWLTLRRAFLGPLILLLAALTVGPAIHAFIPGNASGSMGAVAAWGMWMYLLVTLPLELLALAWMGAWLSLSGTRPGQAFGKTVLLVIVIPLFLFCVPSFLAAGLWLGYARGRMARPLRLILQGAGQSGGWFSRAAKPEHLY